MNQAAEIHEKEVEVPSRERLPLTRAAVTHKFSVSGHECYMTVGMYADGRPGELFLTMAKEGSTMAGLMDTIGVLTSMALQYHVPVNKLSQKLQGYKFEPSEPKKASSLVDYIFRWLDEEFPGGVHKDGPPVRTSLVAAAEAVVPGTAEEQQDVPVEEADAGGGGGRA